MAVESTNIKSVGWQEEKEGRGDLEIEFLRGDVYSYSSVPASVYQSMMLAEDKGVFFNKIVRGRYTYRKMEETKCQS